MDTFLNPLKMRQLAECWIAEDTSSFDFGGAIVGDQRLQANLYCKQECTLAGRPFFNAVFDVLNCVVEWTINDGTQITSVICYFVK